MLKDQNLVDLQKNGIKYENAPQTKKKYLQCTQISQGHIHIVNIQTRVANLGNLANQKKKKMLPMWYMRFTAGHMKQCKAINAKC